MAFAVICKSCQARFLLNDDLLKRKVAGKVVTVRCRQCHATIEVDASAVDPKALPGAVKAAPAPPPEPPPAPKVTLKAVKPTPSPPRPNNKSTLMGIGATRPGGATEMVALSPGLLNVRAPSPSPTAPAVAPHDFPEPPPPPAPIEELNADDWEITETPPLAKADTGPVSVDDFIEELPPSLPPPPEDEAPSSTGTPSLKALAHHDAPAAKPRSDDFLAHMTAAMNGGITETSASGTAPTIDVSALATEASPLAIAPSIDVALDMPLTGKQTLPLFALSDDLATPLPAAKAAVPTPKPAPARAASSPSDGSLSPAAVDRPRRGDGEGVRERKNVVAPATKSVPPAATAQRRSGLAAPVVLILAVAAGFLIWKRNAVHPDAEAHAEPASRLVVAAPPPPTPTAAAPSEPPAAPLASVAAAPAAADDISFETTPVKPAQPSNAAATVQQKPTPSNAPTPTVEKPAGAAPTPEPEPAKPTVKEEPPAPPPSGEPAGPFDRAAAAAALTAGAAQASACRKDGDPSGVASVVITFAPSGRVTSANISGPPFAGTPTGGCIAAALRKARVPAFDGDRVTVSKTIVIQ